MPEETETAIIDRVLARSHTIAVIGASPSPDRASNRVMRTLLDHGYEVVPVTPKADEVHGRPAYPTLADIPAEVRVDLVDIFRRSEHAGAHVDEAIERGAGAVWLQLGVIDQAAVERARAAGLDAVMDRCPAIELRRAA